MIRRNGSEQGWLEVCLMGAIEDATGEVLSGAHLTEPESRAGYLRVLRDILREKGIPLPCLLRRGMHRVGYRLPPEASNRQQAEQRQGRTNWGRHFHSAAEG
jgi:hypothetical protein